MIELSFNDWGLFLEIIGFVMFIIQPAKETYYLLLNSSPEPRFKRLSKLKLPSIMRLPLTIIGLIMVILGLILQFSMFAENVFGF